MARRSKQDTYGYLTSGVPDLVSIPQKDRPEGAILAEGFEETPFSATSRRSLTRDSRLSDTQLVNQESKRQAKSTQTITVDQLRTILESVSFQAAVNEAFASESVKLLEKTLGEIRILSIGLRPLADEAFHTVTEPHKPAMSAQETIDRLKELRELDAIQAFLERFVSGKTWGDLASNRLIATEVTDHLRDLNLRVACQKDDEPAVLRCYAEGTNPNGSFKFEHKSGDRHGGTTIVPLLRLVDAPEKSRPGRRKKT